MHLNLPKKMHNEKSVILINYDSSYLQSRLESIGYKVHPIDYYNTKNLSILSDRQMLKKFIDTIKINSEKIKCVYGSGLEGKSEILDSFRDSLNICGNNLDLFRKCGFIYNFENEIQESGFLIPEIFKHKSNQEINSKRTVYKPKDSCGGYGINFLSPRNENYYSQEYIDDETYSCSFFIREKEFTFLGFNKLFKLCNYKNEPFIHAGASVVDNNYFSDDLVKLFEKFSIKINLNGYNSIDFIYSKNSIYIIDINPRLTSTFLLYNESSKNNLLKAQLDEKDCEFESFHHSLKSVSGFVHVFSKNNFKFNSPPVDIEGIFNIPSQGDYINRGEPIFSIFSCARKYDDNIANLRDRFQITKKYYDIYDIIF